MHEPSQAVISTLQILARFGQGCPAVNRFEAAVAAVLGREVDSRESMRRFVGRWTGPGRESHRDCGSRRSALLRPEPETDSLLTAVFRSALARGLEPGGPGFQVVASPPRHMGGKAPRISPPKGWMPASPATEARYHLDVTGIRRQEEAHWNRRPAGDAPRVLCVTVQASREPSARTVHLDGNVPDASGEAGPGTTFGARRPFGAPFAGDRLPAAETALITTVLAPELQDVEDYGEEARLLARAGQAIAETADVAIPSAVANLTVGVLNALVDTTDPPLRGSPRPYATREPRSQNQRPARANAAVLSPGALPAYAGAPLIHGDDRSGYHFWTYHAADNAQWYVTYRLLEGDHETSNGAPGRRLASGENIRPRNRLDVFAKMNLV